MPPCGTPRPRVLIVDDEQVIADSLALILSQSGFETWASYSGEDALEVAKSVRPDAILSDVVMGGMSGVQLALRILDELPGCEVLLFSGQAMTHDLLKEAEARGHSFQVIAKPAQPSRVVKVLRELLLAG